MPGIADSPAPAINTAPIAAIGSEQPATPALNDFMQAFRTGFITVDDLTRRTKQSVADTDQLKTSLSVNDVTRRKAEAERQLLPGQISEAETQQQIQQATAPARKAAANKLSEDELLRLNDFPKWVAKQSDMKTVEDYTASTGVPPPKTLTVKNPEKPLEFEEWLQHVGPQVTEGRTKWPENPSPEEQDLLLRQERQELDRRYREYLKRAETIEAPEGTPEYAKELKRQVLQLREKAEIHGAKLKALPTILENRAKADDEAGGKSITLAQTNRKDYAGLDEIQALRKVDAAYRKVQTALTGVSNPFQDMSAIFGFMKVLDPGSTVREGEYATAENARAVPETIKNFYNKVVTGQKLTEEQRKQMLVATEGAVQGQVQNALPRVKQYLDIEGQLGLEPGEIVPKEDAALVARFGSAAPAPGVAASAPTAGTKRVIQNGVTFEWNGTTYVPVQ